MKGIIRNHFRIRLLTVILLTTASADAFAQDGCAKGAGIAGYNATYGYFAGAEVSANYVARSWFQARGGLRYCSFPRYALDIRPGIYHNLKSGRIYAEALVQGAMQSSSYDICAGANAGYRHKWFWISLGYYFRHLLPSDGGRGLSEPMNIMYELGVSLLPNLQKWDLEIVITNNRLTEVERFFQPSLIAELAYYPLKHLGIYASGAIKRAGMFNISSNNYQEYLSIGVEYKW